MKRSLPGVPVETAVVALEALAWILADAARADRFLALTGLAADDLRARIDDPALHDAIVAFLAANEADLLACAEHVGRAPDAIVRAGDGRGA